jgi:diguanylate cyclase (GGDEF)-like protein/PAS domain S-box-containing protein
MVNFYHPIVHDHDLRLLLLAMAVGLIGCLSAGGLLWGVSATVASLRRAWKLAALLVFGCTLFSTHSIAMLAVHPYVDRAFPLAATIFSLLVVFSGLAAVLVDHQARRASSRELVRLHQLAEGALEGMVLCREEQILDANLAFCTLLGLSAHSLRKRPITHLASPSCRAALASALRNMAPGPLEIYLCTSTGVPCPVEVFSHPIEYAGHPATVLAVRDLSEHKRAEERMEHLLHHDALTNLANRRLFQDRLQQALAEADHAGETVALLYIDLNRFKSVNDLLGHATGDDLLVQVAARMQETTRHTDTVARLGGDEFAIVLPRIQGAQNAAMLAARLISLIQQPVSISGHPVSVGASIGIAMYPQDGTTADALLQNADLALYRAKQYRGSSFCFYEPHMDRKLQDHRVLEIELQEALQKGQLHLNYQPLFATGSLRLVAFEALLRWQHPQRGWVSPVEFIPLAEETGLILSIGRWVLHAACAEAILWSRPYRISVNVSAIQVQHSNLVETVAEVLETTGLPPEQLELEVTESLFLGDLDAVLATLHDLKALGVRITLDDFGTGYSSLSYLRRFPFDHLKIDRSFILALGQDEQADAIVRSIVALSHSLNLSVTAEGVETEAQLAALQSNDCDTVQGFLLGRPTPSSALASLRGPSAVDPTAPLGPFRVPSAPTLVHSSVGAD